MVRFFMLLTLIALGPFSGCLGNDVSCLSNNDMTARRDTSHKMLSRRFLGNQTSYIQSSLLFCRSHKKELKSMKFILTHLFAHRLVEVYAEDLIGNQTTKKYHPSHYIRQALTMILWGTTFYRELKRKDIQEIYPLRKLAVAKVKNKKLLRYIHSYEVDKIYKYLVCFTRIHGYKVIRWYQSNKKIFVKGITHKAYPRNRWLQPSVSQFYAEARSCMRSRVCRKQFPEAKILKEIFKDLNESSPVKAYYVRIKKNKRNSLTTKKKGK